MTPDGFDGAMFAFPIAADSDAFATLTAYRYCPAASTPAMAAAGMDLAAIAAIALTEHFADHVQRIESAVDGDDISIAVGILSARLELAADDAAALLRATAFGQGMRPCDIAADIIAGRSDPFDR
ncbi:hypothetical protein DK926_24200 [Rhodococcus sp. Eu-32]|uniref:hypothetical protein n=1 Tax=Rhodococcus sp. Eu-32 TaxID=1017319 RepID=UPI000F7AA91D|nr:hypothetical protein [Rhodococcus sp. Eu-32]RRQ25284.1 hypothetical protein DK926_24200 [Rhodococcus sp. Eu-32]